MVNSVLLTTADSTAADSRLFITDSRIGGQQNLCMRELAHRVLSAVARQSFQLTPPSHSTRPDTVDSSTPPCLKRRSAPQ
jgi:hypothetical protein